MIAVGLLPAEGGKGHEIVGVNLIRSALVRFEKTQRGRAPLTSAAHSPVRVLPDAGQADRERHARTGVGDRLAGRHGPLEIPRGASCGFFGDIVWMLRCAARRTSGPQMLFGLHVRNDNRDRMPPLVNLGCR